ncbi:hypothetical protein QN345_17255 [Cryobacterium sp. 10I1]|uniref:hypothetical protein n=1 Tax=Cryobacterium sp. 10I1 TaxID=3048578 RepID=UPI002B2265C2|nr:hypothetical protein [Cryobacterium sp. 10I1]MEB0307048.1 hypothetical protein [Cryobacterium sp. 10I1]
MSSSGGTSLSSYGGGSSSYGGSPCRAADARITLHRDCPLCVLLRETRRTRAQLVGTVAAGARGALAQETRIGAVYDWICTRGHSRYTATVREALTGPGCPRCQANAAAPAARFEGGVPFMKPGLRLGTSATEQRLRVALGERIRLPHRVNAVRISRTFYGKPEVWPDIIIPALRIAIEYDDPGRDGLAHRGLKEASDREKDAALNEVGWEVIRVRAGGLTELGRHSIVCRAVTTAVVDRILELLVEIRGSEAVSGIRRDLA